jgi:hypothetical protein
MLKKYILKTHVHKGYTSVVRAFIASALVSVVIGAATGSP